MTMFTNSPLSPATQVPTHLDTFPTAPGWMTNSVPRPPMTTRARCAARRALRTLDAVTTDDPADRSSSVENLDPGVTAAAAKTATWGRYQKRLELYVKSDRAVRIGAGVLGGLLILGAVVWARESISLFSPTGLVCGECAPDWFRWAQAVLALGGVAATFVLVAYLSYFSATGSIWRRRRGVATTFGGLLAAWSILVILFANPDLLGA